ncbi:MAG: 4-hydroxy-3-methylbut-2-enyl diphosphate reductase [Bacteroidaceae bacterium]|nr:4-hydroxy-3-methylbut-2-enyl diphosphate reductase [Bacteroidaceae bacterium]
MTIEIDKDSGFCFGVLSAIGKAENELRRGEELYCLGDIVHNSMECHRLQQMGLKTINQEQYARLRNARVLLRAHGEPPVTYRTALAGGITLIDATCPVVLKLQKRIKEQYSKMDHDRQQIVIYGQKGHAEVLGLVGQTEGTAIVIENIDDTSCIDFSRDIFLYSQTTKSTSGYNKLISRLQSMMKDNAVLNSYNTICGQVSHRRENIRIFAASHDTILFVSDQKSSNGKVLFDECRQTNPRTFSIEGPGDITPEMYRDTGSIGICGATSTPKWLMEQCRKRLLESVEIQ